MSIKAALIHKGVDIRTPDSVDIGNDIDVDRISGQGVTIYSGSKIYGTETFIAHGTQIGFEGPATINNCYLGPEVKLKGGFYQDAAFLANSSCGLGTHVRRGTILEEQASVAHTVGLKQTILFPYVILGSLINFCDCLMAGGTNRHNHSEVGSSYIHFNYTPNQDKATPSLMGDVCRGVMLNQSPIFLGGQGGLVGPCKIAYGTIVAAGCICRKDQLKENHLVMEGGTKSVRIPFKPGGFSSLQRILNHNFYYIGNLLALDQWYDRIRRLFVGPDFPQPLATGLRKVLGYAISERIRQLARLKHKIEPTLSDTSHAGAWGVNFCDQWQGLQEKLTELQNYPERSQSRDQFIQHVEHQIQNYSGDYLDTIKSLDSDQMSLGTQWLQSIVGRVTALVDEIKPS